MSHQFQNYPQFTTATITIASNDKVSAEVDLGDFDLVGIITPSTFDGTDITFTASDTSGGTFVPVAASKAASTAYTIVTTQGVYTPIDPTVFTGLRYIKVNSTTSQTTTNTIFKLALRKKV